MRDTQKTMVISETSFHISRFSMWLSLWVPPKRQPHPPSNVPRARYVPRVVPPPPRVAPPSPQAVPPSPQAVRAVPTCCPRLKAKSVKVKPTSCLSNMPLVGVDPDMELDVVSSNETLSAENKGCQFSKPSLTNSDMELDVVLSSQVAKKWEELSRTESSCREPDSEDEYEEMIRMTKHILQQHRGQVPDRRSHRRSRSPLPQGRSGRALGNDDGSEHTQVELRKLRYSQLSCRDTFKCGRSLKELVQDLLDENVSTSEPFLRLTVFETIDELTNKRLLRCIDNRRLYALKEYAMKRRNHHLMVSVRLFRHKTLMQVLRFIKNRKRKKHVTAKEKPFSNRTLMHVQRFIQNSDDTDGLQCRLRKSKNKANKKQKKYYYF